MINLLSVLIVIITVLTVRFLIKADGHVIRYHRQFIGSTFAIIEEIKDIRQSLNTVNKLIRVLTQTKIINVFKLITKTIDVLSIFLLFMPAKSKLSLVKRFLSFKFLKYAYSLYQSITA